MSFFAGLILGLMILFFVILGRKEGKGNIKTNLIKSLNSFQKNQSHQAWRFNKVLSWCEKKYKTNAQLFVERTLLPSILHYALYNCVRLHK